MADRGGGAGAGLRSQQQEAERMARELMDMKIETAHLRERLRLRVGGDTNAAELEAEAFALQAALAEAQQALKTRETELQELDQKYQKAMHGLMRLDEAWKLSKKQTEEAQDAQQAAERHAMDEKQRGDELQQQLEASNWRETVLANRVDDLVQEKTQVQQQRDQKTQEAEDREMQVHELRAQLEATRQKFETQMKEQEGTTREDVRLLQEKLQQAEEQAAALRGEIHARQEEAAKVEADLRDTKEAEAATKQRLVKLTEDYATLTVHLESAKLIAVENTQRAIQAESEVESLRSELEEREDLLEEKEQAMQTLEEELVRKQKVIEEEMAKSKRVLQETEERLTKESQEMLQAQEQTWGCRERALQDEAESYKQKLARMQAFHVELARLLQMEDSVDGHLDTVEPAMLKALVVQEINKRDVLTTTLGQMKLKLGATKRQLISQKQLEAENSKFRAEYERAKLAMERMATRKAKSFGSVVSTSSRQHGSSNRSCSSESSVSQENRGIVAPVVKRQLDIDEEEAIDLRTTPRKAQRSKHVYVASRYLSSASKR
ncbi:Laminin subunit beta-2 [Phytophthora citrophthora]|uniref:Laminin subunit beta-2 n=1 Tax=Phytophthora citrophthora TaxID=4793 RepID=A0AAD9GWR3_9STRA|nr:Laminin subunit beta-2 [Phytophthora citrophthora]